MKLLPDGPDIPPELLVAQEKGEVLFICGAGVSMTIGFPSFRGLVSSVYKKLGENWKLHPFEREVMKLDGCLKGQYDRALRSLERRLTGPGSGNAGCLRKRLRDVIRMELQILEDVNLETHAALLDLSRDSESKTRLVTTNFDTLFERAWPRAGKVPSFAGPAMPQPKATGCAGVMHLHGRLGDEDMGLDETDLVLTSAEFGDAYLRSGWASRYVYDLVRAYTVVLVGYQADDPPMRYLLEVIEEDRQRYPDLQQVYAFANAGNDEEFTRALWENKGVTPILHSVDKDESYDPLYRSIREWKEYAQNPSEWCKKELQQLFSKGLAVAEKNVQRITELLHHGKASLILSELNPQAGWLSVLQQQRLFDSENASPGAWISARLNDPDMIRAAAAHPKFDGQTVKNIERTLEQKQNKIGPVRTRCWEVMLSAKKPRAKNDHDIWWHQGERFQAGKVDYEVMQMVADLLRPRVRVTRHFQPSDKPEDTQSADRIEESLESLLLLDFKPPKYDYIDTKEIVDRWPDDEVALVRLLQKLERSLLDALEYAEDAGFTIGYDRSDRNVPSVAPHDQNQYGTGFYPIVRVIADLWERLAQVSPDKAKALTHSWREARFLLLRRLTVFATTNKIHPASDLFDAIMGLNDREFWFSGAQVEIMRGILARWDQFTPEARAELENRITTGIPREIFKDDAFNDEYWKSARDNATYRRLNRLVVAKNTLSHESADLLQKIAQQHPEWSPSPSDRDDFHRWIESGTYHGANIGALKDVPEERLLSEALRIEQEHRFDQSGLWRELCSANPGQALRGLLVEAKKSNWNVYAWCSLFLATGKSFNDDLGAKIAVAVFDMPDATISELASTIAYWIRIHRAYLSDKEKDGSSLLWMLWDPPLKTGSRNRQGD